VPFATRTEERKLTRGWRPWQERITPYRLITIFGSHLAIKSDWAVYVTRFAHVEVVPRSHRKCTEEIPALLNTHTIEIFVDPISYVIMLAGSPVHCNDIAPLLRYKLGGKWYCSYPDLRECHDPAILSLMKSK
jgi:hypothetical protein